MFGDHTQRKIKPILYGHYFYMRRRRAIGDDFYNVLGITLVRMEDVVVRYDFSVDTENVYMTLTDVPPCGLIHSTGQSAPEIMEELMRKG